MKINHILAALAVVAGISAAFTNHADRNGLYPAWKFNNQLVEMVKIRTISAPYLAQLIYANQMDLVVVDLRSEEEFREYHIPSAVPYIQAERLEPSGKTMVVLYGAGEEFTDEKIPDNLRHKSCLLSGGIKAWYDLVLFPDFQQFQVRNRQQLEEIIAKSRYFGGTPQNIQRLNLTERADRYREGC
jgi:rhodanese-related sulfurtransferase